MLFAKELWLKSVKQLAIGIASITNILSPEVVVLGGGITEANNDLFDPLNEYMAQYEWRAGGNKTTIVKAIYGDLAGAAGVATLLWKCITVSIMPIKNLTGLIVHSFRSS
jgi:glucokinase